MARPNSANPPGFVNAPPNPVNLPLQFQNNNNLNLALQIQQHMAASNQQNQIPNGNFPAFQNNQTGSSNNFLGSVLPTSQQGQFHSGLGPQNNPNFMNFTPSFPVNVAPLNLPQLAQSLLNMLHQHNLNMNLQNINQNGPMQVSNPPQGLPLNYGSYPMFGVPNQVSPLVPQNPNFSANPQLGVMHCNQVRPQVPQNQNNFAPSNVNTNTLSSTSGVVLQQWQGAPPRHNSFQPQHTNNSLPSSFPNSQGVHAKNGNMNFSNSNWKGSPSKNSMHKPNKMAVQGGSQKSKFHNNKNNGKRKSGFPHGHEGKGLSKKREGSADPLNSVHHNKAPKISWSAIYSEQDIQQWLEARRKNYPTKANIDKKKIKEKGSEIIDGDTKLRREQLTEILAKQAELGVEVAEIPSHYLSEAGKQHLEREKEGKPMTKKEKKKKRFERRRRRRHDKEDMFAKKRKLADHNSSQKSSLNNGKQTLHKKLLSADSRRNKSHLLQVFRFIAMNSFFLDCQDKPFKYPSVEVKYLQKTREDISDCANAKAGGKTENVKNDDAEYNDHELDEHVIEDNDTSEWMEGRNEELSEEGEIVD